MIPEFEDYDYYRPNRCGKNTEMRALYEKIKAFAKGRGIQVILPSTNMDHNHDKETFKDSSASTQQGFGTDKQSPWVENVYQRASDPVFSIVWQDDKTAAPGTGVLRVTRTKHRDVHSEGQATVLRCGDPGYLLDWSNPDYRHLGAGEIIDTADPIDTAGTVTQRAHRSSSGEDD